jgi:hypothetical protein
VAASLCFPSFFLPLTYNLGLCEEAGVARGHAPLRISFPFPMISFFGFSPYAIVVVCTGLLRQNTSRISCIELFFFLFSLLFSFVLPFCLSCCLVALLPISPLLSSSSAVRVSVPACTCACVYVTAFHCRYTVPPAYCVFIFACP